MEHNLPYFVAFTQLVWHPEMHLAYKTSVSTPPVTRRKGNIEKKLSLWYSSVYCYNGAQRYEQLLQAGWLHQALILLGLAPCLPSTFMSSVFMVLDIYPAQNIINLSSCPRLSTHKISSKSIHNFFRYPAKIQKSCVNPDPGSGLWSGSGS